MDFHSLPRKELQALCKKNKIPANLTNVAMADALKTLEKVEGPDEIINQTKNDTRQSSERTTNVEPRTAARTSTRRNPINLEPESSQPFTRSCRTTRRTVAEEADQENQNVILLDTLAIPTTRKRATAASASKNIDVQLMENEEDDKTNLPKTPAVQSSRRKAPTGSSKKNGKSVQKVYNTRQSVRLLEKSLAELSLKEKRGIKAVKIEGLGDETEEIEQNEDVSAGHSEVVSCQNLDQFLENETETKHEIREEKNTDDHEVDESFVVIQNLDKPLDNECEMKDELDVDNESVHHEGESDILCQDKDELIKSRSAEKCGLEVDNEINDNEMIDCKSCTNLDILLDAKDNDCSNGTSSLQEETADIKAIHHESINDNGQNFSLTEHLETSNASLNPEEEMNDHQHSIIVEASDDNSAFVMETENISADVTDSLASKVSEVMGKSSEMNLIEDGGDDLHLKAAAEEISDGNVLDEVPDDDESDEESNGSEHSLVSDVSLSVQVSDGSMSDEVQENDDTGKIQKAPLLPETDYGNSHSRNEPESPRFHLQDEKCKEASDSLVNECIIDYVRVIEAKESESVKSPRSSTSLKQICSQVSSPCAANTNQGQFPRPIEPTPRKPSAKKTKTLEKIIDPDIINKENVDNSGRKVEPKKDKMKKKGAINMSLRKLNKMLKEQLTIANENKNEENNVAKGGNRLALQEVPENFTAPTETEH